MSILSNSPNHFLSSLSAQDAQILEPHIKLVEMPTRAVLYRAEGKIEQIYFPYTGMVSFVVGVLTGEAVEAGVVGRNSAIGIGSPIDGTVAMNEAIVQVTMSAAMVSADLMKQVSEQSSTLRHLCVRHEELALGQVQQVAACNALHTLEQRLARWLLQARDLLNSDAVPLTQESLSQMLGVNRSSVTLTARRLQETGLIDYHRGDIYLVDVDALKDVSCECYDAISNLIFRLIGWSANGRYGH